MSNLYENINDWLLEQDMVLEYKQQIELREIVKKGENESYQEGYDSGYKEGREEGGGK